MRTCPYCAEEIKDEAIRCRWCGSDLTLPPEQVVARPPIPVQRQPVPGRAPTGRRRIWRAVLGLGVAAAVATSAVVFFPWTDRGQQGRVGQRVLLERAAAPGPDPFTPPVAPPPPDLGSLPLASPQAAGTRRAEVPGSQPGLYGGTQLEAACDAGQLVSFLQANPAKARAWAGVLGVAPRDIGRYVDGLTPVVLTVDLRVTNHGFLGGKATARQSVLQAGTAVMVDDYGIPRVRCFCGNPLLPPREGAAGGYAGEGWEGFSAEAAVVVSSAGEPVPGFQLVDLETGGLFVRPPGTGGGADTQGLIAFTRSEEACKCRNLYVVPAGGGRPVALTEYRHYFENASGPSWSPDGGSIAYALPGFEGYPDRNVARVSLDGSTGGLGFRGISAREVAWSPDGSRVAFTGQPSSSDPLFLGGAVDLYVADLETGEVVQVTTNPDYAVAAGPAWSRDGRWIAYSNAPDFESSISFLHVVRPNGNGDRILIGGDGGYYGPAWSPDGGTIAFARFPFEEMGGGFDVGQGDIYLMNPDGSGARQLTASRADESSPSWSPDGKHIVFSRSSYTRGSYQGAHLFVMNADGSGLRRLTRGAGDDRDPAWQPVAGWGIRPGGSPGATQPQGQSVQLTDGEGGQALLTIFHQGDYLDVEIEPLTAEFRFDVLGLIMDGLTLESLWIDDYVRWEGAEPASDLIVVGRDAPVLRFSVRPTPAQDFSRPFVIEWLSLFGKPATLTVLPPSATGRPAPEGKVYLYHLDIWSGPTRVLHVRPETLVLDNHNGFEGLDWSGWGTPEAVARGVFHYDDCVPTCGEGTYHDYAVEIRAADLRRCVVEVETPEGGPASRRVSVYNSVTVRYLDPGGPDYPFLRSFERPCESAEA